MNYKDHQNRRTLTDCSSPLNAITNNLDPCLRQAGEFKIITFLTHFIRERIPREVNNFYHCNYYFSIFFMWILSYPTIGHLIAPGLQMWLGWGLDVTRMGMQRLGKMRMRIGRPGARDNKEI
jgi:hypothetical protein